MYKNIQKHFYFAMYKNDTSIMTTWVKSYQLSTIWQKKPKWKVASYWWYEYNDDLSKGLPVIDNTSTITTWVKGF